MAVLPEPKALRALEVEARKAAKLAEAIRGSLPSLDPKTAQAYVRAATHVYKQARTYLKLSVLPEAETLNALREDAERIRKQAKAVSATSTPPDPQVSQALANDARRALKEARAYLRSAPLPPPEVLGEMAKRHLAYLESLDAEYGPPSAEDIEAADCLLDSLGFKR